MIARCSTPRERAQPLDERLHEALRVAGVAAFHIDIAHGRRLWSREAGALMGLSPDAQPDYEELVRAVHPEDLERVRKEAYETFARGECFETECRLVWPDGSIHWIAVVCRAHLDEAGQARAVEGVVQRADERKRLEGRLLDTQRTLRSLLAHMPGLVYRARVDENMTALFVSEGFRELSGYTVSQLLRNEIAYADLVHPEDRARVRERVKAAVRERRAYENTYRICTSSGEIKWVWDRGVGVHSPEGELQFIEGFVTDVTASKRAAAERADLEARLRQAQKMEAIGTLAGGIAHDFNNVLAAIRGNAMLAIEDAPPDSPVLSSLREIERSAKRAADLVRQILTFSRQENARRRPVDMSATVEEAVRLLRATLPPLIEIRTAFAGDLPMVEADPTQIHQIVMNLGANAAQAIGSQSGAIEVRLDAVVVNGSEYGELLQPGPHVRLRISDTGPGMDAATLERIYDPFFTTKPPGQGTGLGLSVVHGIVSAHGGSISVESAPQKGTTFTLCFPAARVRAAADAPVPSVEAHGVGQHILYVDDEETLVSLAERALVRRGYQVTGQTSPVRALEVFRAAPERFDVVVTDLLMPEMSGRDLAAALLRIRPHIPIVLTSGRLTAADAAAAKNFGIRAVVAKPGSIDDVVRAIAAALAQELRS